MVGPHMPCPMMNMPLSLPNAPSSCCQMTRSIGEAPRPPYSLGQCRQAQPASAFFFCQALATSRISAFFSPTRPSEVARSSSSYSFGALAAIQARAWIAANAPKEYEDELRATSLGRVGLKNADILQVAKDWQKKKADAGWACLHWPKEYGGRGASPIERVIWQQEEGAFGKLSGMFIIGHGMCGPTMMGFAGEEQKRKYLPPLASGENIWCQLFSEPAGGSDVAGLRTRAEKKGDDWIVNGQKIWTSSAPYSYFGLLLTRTDPNVPKHKGLTMFFLDKKRSSVEIKP